MGDTVPRWGDRGGLGLYSVFSFERAEKVPLRALPLWKIPLFVTEIPAQNANNLG